jgi:hypothetical protein
MIGRKIEFRATERAHGDLRIDGKSIGRSVSVVDLPSHLKGKLRSTIKEA